MTATTPHFTKQATPTSFTISWSQAIPIDSTPVPPVDSRDARGIRPGRFGSEYCRLVKLANGHWLAVYTIYPNAGYKNDPKGGTQLRVAVSKDNCRTWTTVTTVAEPGRDVDNGQLLQLPSGDVLLACRSVIWQQSYRLHVYRSTDSGATWHRLSTIDANEGAPGSLGRPDKGVYEPDMFLLPSGNVAVMYANEKHVVENPSYSQIVSEKVSTDGGASWGREIDVASEPGGPRPGMPVSTRMTNGRYIAVYEVCGPENCNIYYKTSANGKSWPAGLGTVIPQQLGGPYVLSMTDGLLAVTSNTGNVSCSSDYGATWSTETPPWPNNTLWGSLYQTGPTQIAAVTSVARPAGGHIVQLKFGEIEAAGK